MQLNPLLSKLRVTFLALMLRLDNFANKNAGIQALVLSNAALTQST